MEQSMNVGDYVLAHDVTWVPEQQFHRNKDVVISSRSTTTHVYSPAVWNQCLLETYKTAHGLSSSSTTSSTTSNQIKDNAPCGSSSSTITTYKKMKHNASSGSSSSSSTISSQMKDDAFLGSSSSSNITFKQLKGHNASGLSSSSSTSSKQMKHSENVHQCEFCKKVFSSSISLKRHFSVHSNDQPFSCQKCDKKFKRKENLKQHTLIHFNLTPHTCEVCGEAFRRKDYLQNHISKQHSGVYRFTCENCTFRTNNSGDMKLHIAIHTGVKNFKCEQCNYVTNWASDLKEHLRKCTGERIENAMKGIDATTHNTHCDNMITARDRPSIVFCGYSWQCDKEHRYDHPQHQK